VNSHQSSRKTSVALESNLEVRAEKAHSPPDTDRVGNVG
jgi:hypothetical protein